MIVDKKLIKVRKLVILFLCAILYFKCTNNFESTYSNKIWFGGYEILDPLNKNSITSLSNYIKVVNDSLLVLYWKNEFVDSIKNEPYHKKFKIENEVLTLYDDFKFTSAINSTFKSINSFRNKLWTNEEYELYLTDSTMFLKKINLDLTIYKCYKLENFNQLTFLNTFGNKWVCNQDLVYFQYQIVQNNEKSLFLKGFFDGDFKTIGFKQSKKILEDTSSFTLCNDFFNMSHPRNRYSHTRVKYLGGIYNINKEFHKKYVKPNNLKESGSIRVRFVINCRGETGNFEILELDENYKQKRFNKQISDQILSICKELDEWIPGSVEGQKVDSYKFLSFKIKNSEIVEIFP